MLDIKLLIILNIPFETCCNESKCFSFICPMICGRTIHFIWTETNQEKEKDNFVYESKTNFDLLCNEEHGEGDSNPRDNHQYPNSWGQRGEKCKKVHRLFGRFDIKNTDAWKVDISVLMNNI